VVSVALRWLALTRLSVSSVQWNILLIRECAIVVLLSVAAVPSMLHHLPSSFLATTTSVTPAVLSVSKDITSPHLLKPAPSAPATVKFVHHPKTASYARRDTSWKKDTTTSE